MPWYWYWFYQEPIVKPLRDGGLGAEYRYSYVVFPSTAEITKGVTFAKAHEELHHLLSK